MGAPTAPSSPAAPAATEKQLVQLLAAASRSGNGAGSSVAIEARFDFVAFELLVTSAAGGAGATLDVWVQQTWDLANWDDVAHYTQVLGTVGSAVYVASLPTRRPDVAAELHQMQDAALAAGSVRDTVLARRFRAKWEIAGGGTFNFEVWAAPRLQT